MMAKVLITGATGYIGGDALVEIVDKHPDWVITCLVRSEGKGTSIKKVYPHVKTVVGDLDSVDLIEREASQADIVYNFADCDHEPCANAIIAGLSHRTTDSPGYLIHTSGTGILMWKAMRDNTWGEDDTSVIYDDGENVSQLTSLPDSAPHRPVDKIVLAASAIHPQKIKTAIVCPPAIYGVGRGPGNTQSIQLNLAARAYLQSKQAFSVGAGRNVWHGVHVRDLSRLYLLLGEAAIEGKEAPGIWGEEGYYFAENGQFVWGDAYKAIARAAFMRGLLESDVVVEKTMEEAAKYDPRFGYAMGGTARGVAKRATKLLGWKPVEPSLFDLMPELIESEAKGLGLL